MKNKGFEQFLNEDDGPLEMVQLDLEKVKTSVLECSNEKLCEMIATDRYFGFGEKIAPLCMEELARRRVAGDTFAFESCIEQAHKSLPVLNFAIPDLRTVLMETIKMRSQK